MRNHWQEILKVIKYQPGETILDVGGAMDPMPIADMVVDVIDLGLGGKNYTIMDITSEPLPFADKSYDIVICSQTLEDLASPTLILREMSRVGKRGIIESPHRGPESVKSMMPAYKGSGEEIPFCFGAYHHKWLIELIDNTLVFTPKNYLFLMRHPIPKWTGPGGVNIAWYNNIPFRVNLDIHEQSFDENYKKFKEDNKKYWE